ncbi:MAG: hypothetical protein ACRC0Y_04205 [Fusobacteriaceae bacterium]
MFKKVLFLLGIGSFLLNVSAYGSVFEIQEYSNLKKYLKPEQQTIFVKVIGGKLDMIKYNENIIEILKNDADKNSESIENIQKKIENLKLENDSEILKLKRDFIKNPQRYLL